MGAYYYAAGRRIDLEHDDEHVAIDRKTADQAGLRSVAADAPRHAGGVVVASRAALPHDALASLQRAGALQPVFKRDRAMVVALPEVRVEFDTLEQRTAVEKLLAGGQLPAHTVAEETGDRIVITPASGNGIDALQIANAIYERAHSAAASVRFVQVVPKPDVSGQGTR